MALPCPLIPCRIVEQATVQAAGESNRLPLHFSGVPGENVGTYMRGNGQSLDIILALLTQMEATLLGLKQLRGFVGDGPAQQRLEALIHEAEAKIAEVKRRIIQ